MRRRFWMGLTSAIALLSFAAEGRADTVTNGVYELHVDSAGSWNAITGPDHPTNAGNDLLYDGTITSTNYSSLRIYGAGGGTYSFSGTAGGLNLNSFLVGGNQSSTLVSGVNGVQTDWLVSGLAITQDVLVTGTDYTNSAIYHTVLFQNTGASAMQIGWRNLYDWAVNDPGFDDGPTNQVETVGGGIDVATTNNEFTHTPGAGDVVRVARSDTGGGTTATYEPLLALGYDPNLIASLPVTLPDAYAFVSWPNGFSSPNAFDYTTNSSLNVAGNGGSINDSAGLSWFGRDAASAMTIEAGGSLRITQVIFAVIPSAPPPPAEVPEPASLALAGVAAIAGYARRRRS